MGAAADHAMSHRPVSLTALLAELVSHPSVQPEAGAGATLAGEAALAAWVADYLRRLGADVHLHRLAPGRPSVVAAFEPAGPVRATVAFVPHLDTVGAAGMTVPPFALTRRQGRLHGRGACDTKGPMAALLWALRRWTCSRAWSRNRVRWLFVATAGEEQGSLGAQALLTDGFRADFAIALEPTDLKVIYAAKGLLRVWVEVAGRAAHGAKPWLGVNAIDKALPLLAALRDEVGPALRANRHPVLGPATLNVGVIHGGSDINVVPASCRFGLDIRVHPGCPPDQIMEILRTAVKRHVPDARLNIQRRGPSFVTDRSNPWAKRLQTVSQGWAVADWFCDANLFSQYRIPAVAFGPGSIAQAHTRDEYIRSADLAAGERAFYAYLTDPRIDACIARLKPGPSRSIRRRSA